MCFRNRRPIILGMKTNTCRLTITLADGAAHSFEVDRMPRHWNSWLMQQLPYGTVFLGATFKREAIVEVNRSGYALHPETRETRETMMPHPRSRKVQEIYLAHLDRIHA